MSAAISLGRQVCDESSTPEDKLLLAQFLLCTDSDDNKKEAKRILEQMLPELSTLQEGARLPTLWYRIL